MNEQQKKWLKSMTAALDAFYKQSDLLPDDFEAGVGFINVVVSLCKGHEAEARNALFDVAEKWEMKIKDGKNMRTMP